MRGMSCKSLCGLSGSTVLRECSGVDSAKMLDWPTDFCAEFNDDSSGANDANITLSLFAGLGTLELRGGELGKCLTLWRQASGGINLVHGSTMPQV